MHYVPPTPEAWTSHDLDRLARAASSDHGGSNWQAVLSALFDIHPGAQRALLAIRQGTHFEVQGVTGYPADLLNLRLPLHTKRAWCGQSEPVRVATPLDAQYGACRPGARDGTDGFLHAWSAQSVTTLIPPPDSRTAKRTFSTSSTPAARIA